MIGTVGGWAVGSTIILADCDGSEETPPVAPNHFTLATKASEAATTTARRAFHRTMLTRAGDADPCGACSQMKAARLKGSIAIRLSATKFWINWNSAAGAARPLQFRVGQRCAILDARSRV
jgi:hypothetical protein